MTRKRRTGRILLTLDPETLRGDLIETAVGLARAYDAELVTIFVRTADMLNMAALPFETTVIGPGGVTRTVNTRALENRLDRLARDAEALVARLAGQVPWSFRIATGHLEQIVGDQSTEFDLLTVCGSTARRVRPAAQPSSAALLLLGSGLRRHRPVVAVFEGDTEILAQAYRIAREFSAPLVVAIVAGDARDRTRLRRNARAWLTRRRQSATIIAPDPDTAVAQLRSLQPGLITIARSSSLCTPLHDALDTGNDQAPMLEVPD